MDSQTFFNQIKQTDEGLSYLDLIAQAKSQNRELKKEHGFEIHHIHTRALKGSNVEDNLVKLTIYEHILAHYYLALALPCRETLYPLIILSNRAVRTVSDVQKLSIENLKYWSYLRQEANKALLGRICINNGRKKRYVFEEELEKYLLRGWVKGNLPTTKGRVTMNLDGKSIKVLPDTVTYYEQQGWQIGGCRGCCPPRKGKNAGLRKFMTNGEIEKQVLISDQQEYLDKGWYFGRKPFSEETRAKLSQSACQRDTFTGKSKEGALRRHFTGLGRIWCHLKDESRWVTPEVFANLQKEGWTEGRKDLVPKVKEKRPRKPVSEETRRKQSEARKGRRVSQETREKMKTHRWVCKDGTQLRILDKDLQKYLENGWKQGRYSTTTKGLKSVYNPETGIKKYISEEELELYVQDGWKPGHPATNVKN